MLRTLIIGGIALALLAARKKGISGIGMPYQTYLKFDEDQEWEKENIDFDFEESRMEFLKYRRKPRNNNYSDTDYSISPELDNAAIKYIEDNYIFEVGDKNFGIVYNAFITGAETAINEEWAYLRKSERDNLISKKADDYSSVIYGDGEYYAFDAYCDGAYYIINRDTYL